MYDSDLMSIEELCQERGLTKSQVRYLYRTGRLPAVKFGLRLLFARKAVDAFFANLERQALVGMEVARD